MSELDKLEKYLIEHGFDYERIDEDVDDIINRHQIIVYDKKGTRQWDAICHFGSYGYKDGMLEVMGRPVVKNTDYDSVVGHLSAVDVIRRLEND